MTPHEREVMKQALNEHCPVCGYYCLGNGGVYCIDKPTTVETTRACLAEPEHYDQTELGLCKKCGWKAVWPDGCLVCEKQEAQPEHWSDCAVHSEPAYPKGECDCGGMRPEQKEKWFAGYKAGYAQAQETDLAMPRKAWVGLADWEIDDVQYDVDCRLHRSYARAIEAKLKEKNA